MIMNDTGYVRITEITLENFKNVKYGKVSLENASESTLSILGIYGQNGSGKTALIDALGILSRIFQGQAVQLNSSDFINVEADYAKLAFTFKVYRNDAVWNATYEFKLGKRELEEHEVNYSDGRNIEYVARIYDEKLKCGYEDSLNDLRLAYVMNTENFKVFGPDAKFKLMTGNDKDKEVPLLFEKMNALNGSRSFIFSGKTFELLFSEHKMDAVEEFAIYKQLLCRLRHYGKYELFVIDTRCSGMISLNALPLTVKYHKDDDYLFGRLLLSMDKVAEFESRMMPIVHNVLDNLNIVLSEIIPGLTISIKDYGKNTDKNNVEVNRFELMSIREGHVIPLRYESEGIKKIISILQLLIVAYNTPAITVAVDELDSGIFEYLLGELLRIMSEEAEGQLIFTSHNLRPLEIIDKSFLIFSTANPMNRYIRMENVQENNNLRNVYFRDIQMNYQKEVIYRKTSNTRITSAFIDAGEDYDFE